eukprot:SAG31_NODE_6759_length_1896_cov_1.467446_2_plen_316_part_00
MREPELHQPAAAVPPALPPQPRTAMASSAAQDAPVPALPATWQVQPQAHDYDVDRAGLVQDGLALRPVGPDLHWSVFASIDSHSQPPPARAPPVPAPVSPAHSTNHGDRGPPSYDRSRDCVRRAFNGVTGESLSAAEFRALLRRHPGYAGTAPTEGSSGGATVSWQPLLSWYFGSAYVALPLLTGTRHWLGHDAAVGAVACNFARGGQPGHAEYLPRGSTPQRIAAYDACVGVFNGTALLVAAQERAGLPATSGSQHATAAEVFAPILSLHLDTASNEVCSVAAAAVQFTARRSDDRGAIVPKPLLSSLHRIWCK